MNRRPRTIATYRGDELEAAVYLKDDAQLVVLRSDIALDGFEPEPEGERFVRDVELSECDAVHFVRSVGQYRGLPVAILDELGDQLEVESLAHHAPAAAEAGLERVERGVYRGWVGSHEVQQQRLEFVDLNPIEARSDGGFD